MSHCVVMLLISVMSLDPHTDPARVLHMTPVISVPRKLPGVIRCPVDANPPVLSVRWEKDGYPLRVEKVRQAVCQSVCLSVYLSVCLSVCLSICLSVCLSLYLSICLSVCLSICLSIYLSVCLSVCICLSVCLCVCLSVCLC